jgi:hypothetical protein
MNMKRRRRFRGGELFMRRNGRAGFLGFELLSKSGDVLFRGPLSVG